MTMNPFPGPQPYRAADRDRFFGREDLSHLLERSILANRCVTVYGPSGAGKSSLLQASVFPKLVEKHDVRLIRVDAWPDGEEPTKWLANAIHAELGLAELNEGADAEESVFRAAKGAARSSSRLLVVYLDQLEQLLFSGRNSEETQPFFDCTEKLLDLPLRNVRVVLSLREDYLGRFRDRLRDMPRITENGARIGPMSVAELTDTVVCSAAAGEPAQTWAPDEIRELMMQVRVPGQMATDAAEAQSAYAQIICRALFQERAAGKMVDATEAEAILQRYFASTLDDLGALRSKAQLLLEEHLVSEDGSRTLRTEKELARIATGSDIAQILKQLEEAAILRAEEHHGNRYFEIGHDWLARQVFEQRHAREQALALEREREEARKRLDHARRQRRFYAGIAGVSIALATGGVSLGLYVRAQQARAEVASAAAKAAEQAAKSAEFEAKNKAIEASDARLLAGFRELRNQGQIAWGMKLLRDVQKPEEARGWIALANDALQNGALEVTLRGSQHAFGMAAWSPDGHRIAAASEDGRVWIWKSSGQGEPFSLVVHEKPIRSIAWMPDGARFVTASEDGTAKLVYVDSTQKPTVFDPRVGPLRSAVCSPRGDRIAVLAHDSTIRVWHSDGSGLVEIKGHDGEIMSLVFSPDGGSVITSATDKTARRTAIEGSNQSIVFRGHKDIVQFAAPSPDGAYVVTASNDNTARIWPSSGKGLPVVLEGHRGTVIHAAWSSDGKYVATASLDNSARIWPVDGKTESVKLAADGLSMAAVAFRRDDRYLLTRSFDRTAAIWPVSGGKPLRLDAHEGPIASAGWNPDGSHVLTAAHEPPSGLARDTSVKVWRLEHLEGLPRKQKPFYHTATIGPSANHVLAAFDDRTAQWFRLDGSGEHIRFSGHEDWVTGIAVDPQEKWVLTTSADKTARLWSADGKGDPVVFRGALGIVRAGAIRPNGSHVITGSDDRKIRLWKIDAATLEKELPGHTDIITNLSWSPDGAFFLSTSMDHSARIWTADGAGAPIEIKGHRGGVVHAAWSPDGARIVTASEDFTARVWNGKTGEFQFALEHDGPVLIVAFSQDGKKIATSSVKNGLRVWNADGSGEPVEIQVDSPIAALKFIDDGKRIVTISEDDSTRTFLIDVPVVMRHLEMANHDCLPPEQRVTYLGETPETAKTLHEACERLARQNLRDQEGH